MSVPGLQRRSRRSLTAFPVLVVASMAAAGCGVGIGPFLGKASDTWTHTYPLSQSGEVTIVNVNGKVDVEGVDGSTLEVQAERIARGATDQVARDLLPRIPIEEHATPDFVSIETKRISGFLIGASFEVRYHVKAPRTATVRATTVNGVVTVTAMDGRVIAQTTNGGVVAKEIGGGIEARTVNGGVRVQLASQGRGRDSHARVDLTTINGGVHLALPETAKATVTATWVNGGVTISGLHFEVKDQSKRHFEGDLNGGGMPIAMTTVNGGVTLGTSLDESPGTRRGRMDLSDLTAR
jgi:hypothetical protein